MSERAPIAITGAGGSLARDILPGLIERGHRIVAIDERPMPDAPDGVRRIQLSVSDRQAVARAVTGCRAVVHLAGIPLEAPWEDVLAVNVDGTQAVLEAAQSAGVDRVVLASSIHAVGFVPVPPTGESIPDDVAVRPDTFYGASKAMLESLGALYHARHGLDVICLRIASRFAEPQDERMLRTWLSPADAVRLVHASLTVPDPGFRFVWGVSANTGGFLSAGGGKAIGYHPRDDAQEHVEAVAARVARDQRAALSVWDDQYIGGVFCSPEPPRFVPYINGGRR